ncbi:MAG: hypothetical protein K2G13_04970 [Muribaculaceae bacterium]|nr:hypothetical protein [Muribaculaceae bacterium]
MTLKLRHTILSHVIGPVLMAVLIVSGATCGCGRDVDSRLHVADSLMEEHPDSALTILDEYELPAGAPAYDRAFYGLLLTHARYKNFIDETDDSLISVSADYFLDHGDKEMAARSLFLKGMIELNAERYGDAAISFSKGLDIAKDIKAYMWVGQCARGLSLLYNDLYDGSAEVEYALQAYDAFLKAESEKWKIFSTFELASAYNNNCQYEKSLSITNELYGRTVQEKDTLILSKLLDLRGISFFSLGKFQESLESYRKAWNYDSSILTNSDKQNIRLAIAEVQGDTVADNWDAILGPDEEFDSQSMPFVVLAGQGRYKEAYESLECYKNRQDSVLSLIFRNNVAESVGKYARLRSVSREEKIRNERLSYWLMFLVIVVLGVVAYCIQRERMHKERAARLTLEVDLESLRSDLHAQLENVGKAKGDASKEYDVEFNEDYLKVIRRKYAETNSLCEDFYQGRYRKKKKEEIFAEINNILKDFTDKSGLEKIGEYVDISSGGLYSSFRSEFFDISEENRRLFLYLMLGFSSRTISVIFDQDISAVYNKKSRLKAKIAKSDSSMKDKYLKFF